MTEKGNEEATTGQTKIVRWAKTRKVAEEFILNFKVGFKFKKFKDSSTFELGPN
jgi:ribosomal 50S subunit-recycling heat shock protein